MSKNYSFLIKDDHGADVYFEDLRVLQKHLHEYHSSGSSIHEEPDGSRFTVNDSFRKKIADLIRKVR